VEKARTVYEFRRYEGESLQAKREIPYEIRLQAQLILDELCFEWNKKMLEKQLNESIDTNNKKEFMRLSQLYKQYLWE
jgi:uncharacterized protein YpiB (UPF0302 family)